MGYWAGTALALALAVLAPQGARAQCMAVDYHATALPSGPADPVVTALRAAYPDISLSADGRSLRVGAGAPLPLHGPPAATPQARLAQASIADQFAQPYPLGPDPGPRETPWFDPGRARNEAFFRALWFADRATAEAALTQVRAPHLGGAVFTVTRKRNLACQLEAVLAALAPGAQALAPVFAEAGGGFNWRVIAGTQRLSAHSFGIAVDVNAGLGGYWRWSGAAEGQVGAHRNRIPAEVVTAFERYGFIWGGKWHHFDGMHFEYRPELILHARLLQPDHRAGRERGN